MFDMIGIPSQLASSTGVSSSSSPAADSKHTGDHAESKGTFRLALFPGDDDFFDENGGGKGGGGGYNANSSVIVIDGAAESKSLDKYLNDLDMKDNKRGGVRGSGGRRREAEEEEEDDLLALMDSIK
jgi:hypothetical protein